MKFVSRTRDDRALTLVEVLVIIAILAILYFMILPPNGDGRLRAAGRAACVNNLKQIGQAEFAWADNHGGKFSFELSETNGGTMEYTTGVNEWRHFQLLSNLLETPKVLFCVADPDRNRRASTNFTSLSNSNLSYFAGLDSTMSNPQGMLFGDHNVTNGTSIKTGILELTTNQLVGWTEGIHKKVGNVVVSDGSVQQLTVSGLRTCVGNTGVFTNHFQVPILNP